METDVNLGGGLDEGVWETGGAAGAEDGVGFAEGGVDGFVPPGAVAELEDVAAGVVELGEDVFQAGGGVVEAGGELEEEAAHAGAEEVGDVGEVLDEGFGVFEAAGVGDEFVDLDGVGEAVAAGLFEPGLNGGEGGPGIEGGVELDGFEVAEVVGEPLVGGEGLGIEAATPVPVEPAGAADVEGGGGGFFGGFGCRRFGGGGEAGEVHFPGPADIGCALLLASGFAAFAALFFGEGWGGWGVVHGVEGGMPKISDAGCPFRRGFP